MKNRRKMSKQKYRSSRLKTVQIKVDTEYGDVVAGSKRPVGLRSRVAGAFLIRQELPRYICDNSQTLNSIQIVLHFKVSRVFFGGGSGEGGFCARKVSTTFMEMGGALVFAQILTHTDEME